MFMFAFSFSRRQSAENHKFFLHSFERSSHSWKLSKVMRSFIRCSCRKFKFRQKSAQKLKFPVREFAQTPTLASIKKECFPLT